MHLANGSTAYGFNPFFAFFCELPIFVQSWEWRSVELHLLWCSDMRIWIWQRLACGVPKAWSNQSLVNVWTANFGLHPAPQAVEEVGIGPYSDVADRWGREYFLNYRMEDPGRKDKGRTRCRVTGKWMVDKVVRLQPEDLDIIFVLHVFAVCVSRTDERSMQTNRTWWCMLLTTYLACK